MKKSARNGNSYKIVQCLVWKKIVIISKNNIDISTYDESGKRIGAFKIKSDIFEKEVLLFPIHFYDKKNYDSTEQNERIEKIKKFIDDSNDNPFVPNPGEVTKNIIGEEVTSITDPQELRLTGKPVCCSRS